LGRHCVADFREISDGPSFEGPLPLNDSWLMPLFGQPVLLLGFVA
jgi:hypothetical protein